MTFGRPRRVLLIEQDAFIVLFLEDALARMGCDMVPVFSELAAVTAMSERAFDQVVIAVHPFAIGEAADLLRRLSAFSPDPLPVVVTAGFTPTAAERRQLEEACSGTVSLVAKPFCEDELAQALMTKPLVPPPPSDLFSGGKDVRQRR